MPALAAAPADGPNAERPSAAAFAQEAAAVFDPRRAVQLETVNRFWDERNLTVTRLPVVVGELTGKTTFSRALRQNPKFQSMIIRKPGGDLRLPEGLKQFREAVAAAFAYEKRINPESDGYYAYLTVTQGLVESGKTQKRPNAHTDGYPRRPEDRGEVDRMYLVSDALPTEFFDQPFPVPTAHDFAGIHATFENAADPAKVVVHPDYTLTMMDSYTVHRSRKAEKPEFRTFVQIHFASRLYNMAQNTPNPLFEAAQNKPAFAKIKEYWREYETRYRAAAAGGPIVEKPRDYFASIVDLGKLWWAKTVWGNRMSLTAARWSARRAVRESFEPKAPGSTRTFDSFASRVLSEDNPESPYSKRKRLSHALLDASLLPAGDVASYFDGLLRGETRQAEQEFRRTRAPWIVASFREQANAILSAKLSANKNYNVAGALVAGSYAHGSAKESSDFDLVVLTRDGTGRDVADFMAELESRREAFGWADWKDWRRYPVQNIFGAFDERTLRFARELPVIIVTPDAALRRLLSAEAMSRPIWDASWFENLVYRLAALFRRWRLRREFARWPDAPLPAEERKIPKDLETIYQELPGGGIRRLADDPVLAALREADVQLWTIRHGESESNRAGLLAGSGTNAPLTTQLNAKGLSGELQARNAAVKMYEDLGGDAWAREVLRGAVKPVAILFSPLLRAAQTANALKTLLDDKLKELGGGEGRSLYEALAVPDLREMGYGDLDGTTLVEAKKLPWWPGWDGITGPGRDFLGRFPGGESRFDVLLRQRNVLLWIAKTFPGRKVITFAHFETVTAQRAVLGRLTTDPNDQALRVTPVENAQPLELVGPRR